MKMLRTRTLKTCYVTLFSIAIASWFVGLYALCNPVKLRLFDWAVPKPALLGACAACLGLSFVVGVICKRTHDSRPQTWN